MADKYNISIRLSPAQRAVIDAAAARVGLRAGQWMRQVSLERAAEQAEAVVALVARVRELERVALRCLADQERVRIGLRTGATEWGWLLQQDELREEG